MTARLISHFVQRLFPCETLKLLDLLPRVLVVVDILCVVVVVLGRNESLIEG
jgi:hypothetical protein